MKSLSQKINGTKKVSVPTGTYTSTVTNVIPSPGFADGESYDIQYEFVDEDGNKYDYSERFFNSPKNKRTKKLIDYLENNGIPSDDLDQFIGTHETVTVEKKVSSRGKAMKTITKRSVVKNNPRV